MPFKKKKSPHTIPGRIPTPSERVPLWSLILLGIALVCFILLCIARHSVPFAEFFNGKISAFSRSVFSHVTDILPFSFAEFLILMILPAVIFLIVYGVRRRSETWRSVLCYIVMIFSLGSVIFSTFVLNYGTGYYVRPLDERIELPAVPVTAEDLRDTTLCIIDNMEPLLDSVNYDSRGASVMPYSLDDMNDKLMAAYRKVTAEYTFLQDLTSRVKPVMMSAVMSYTHFTGFYTFFTGESNINVDFPDYSTPYTAAHELAHQRGIARENEANFVAFLVCMASDDDYIRYCGLVNMYEYLASALYSADYTEEKDFYYAARNKLDGRVKGELSAYADFFSKYQSSRAAEVGETLNNAFIKANGVQTGSESYGLVVDLTVAYYKKGFLSTNP